MMMKVHEPPKLATASAMRSPKVDFSSITSLGLRLARRRTSCCEAWNWRPSTVSMSMPAIGLRCSRTAMSSRSTSRQRGLFQGDGVGLVRRLVQHRSEAEELAVAGLVDHDLLMVFVDRGDLHVAGHHDVGVFAGIADLVDALAGSERLQFDLGGQHRDLIVIEQGEERDVFELLGSHGMDHLMGTGWILNELGETITRSPGS